MPTLQREGRSAVIERKLRSLLSHSTNTPIRLDLRGDLIMTDEAANIYGVNRTQVWRYLQKSKIPCIILGTEDHPIHIMRRKDVEHDALLREQKKAIARAAKMRKMLRNAGFRFVGTKPIEL